MFSIRSSSKPIIIERITGAERLHISEHEMTSVNLDIRELHPRLCVWERRSFKAGFIIPAFGKGMGLILNHGAKKQQPNNNKPKQTHQAPADLQLNLLKLPLLRLQRKPPTNSILSSNSPVNGRDTQERRGLRETLALFRSAADGRSGIRETEMKTRSIQILCVCVCDGEDAARRSRIHLRSSASQRPKQTRKHTALPSACGPMCRELLRARLHQGPDTHGTPPDSSVFDSTAGGAANGRRTQRQMKLKTGADVCSHPIRPSVCLSVSTEGLREKHLNSHQILHSSANDSSTQQQNKLHLPQRQPLNASAARMLSALSSVTHPALSFCRRVKTERLVGIAARSVASLCGDTSAAR
ncbi:hypothetical protein QQF64_026336 [Cirrhinus molitorella]|uniref:Uncharacterized protein n=1 Tax=Cirrhinus molitorella TaxID=172907 RepID=A0ABR3N9V0_9TELE